MKKKLECDGDCYNCDYALSCYPVEKKEELLMKRTLAEKAIIHYWNEIEKIDAELAELE